jgi:excisionase family DNA binding protein
MRVKEAAERLEVSTATVYALVASGRLRCHRIGIGRGAIRISDDQLADYLKGSLSEIVQEPPVVNERPRLKYIRL